MQSSLSPPLLLLHDSHRSPLALHTDLQGEDQESKPKSV